MYEHEQENGQDFYKEYRTKSFDEMVKAGEAIHDEMNEIATKYNSMDEIDRQYNQDLRTRFELLEEKFSCKYVAIFLNFIYNIKVLIINPQKRMLWHHRQVVRQRSAKPLFTSSNLVGASKCRCGEMADARDLKSRVRKRTCRFDPDHRHHKFKELYHIQLLFFVLYLSFFRSSQSAVQLK